MIIRIVASYTRLAPLNHYVESLLIIKITPDVFKKRRIVNLKASDMFIFVTVYYFSNNENFLTI